MTRNVKEFASAVGRVPWYDDLERANCPQAGEPGHTMCGWDEGANLPRTMTPPPDREAWREAVRSGDLDRWPHPSDCRDRCCALEEVGE